MQQAVLYEKDMNCDKGGSIGVGEGVFKGADMQASHFTFALLVAPLLVCSQPGLLLLLGLHLKAPQLGLCLVLHPIPPPQSAQGLGSSRQGGSWGSFTIVSKAQLNAVTEHLAIQGAALCPK